jgi:hypothetical protein
VIDMSEKLKVLQALLPVLLIYSFGLNSIVMAKQIDYTGDDRIIGQTWRLEFTVPPMSEDSFCVRLPYPDYTMVGRWATYSTDSLDIVVDSEYGGPFYYEFHHYNEGYSNQGVWIKVIYPPGPIEFTLWVTQSVKLNLPGHDYPLDHYTNNGWMGRMSWMSTRIPWRACFRRRWL